jgi:ribonuclease P protein component
VQNTGRKVQTDHLLLLWQPSPEPAPTRTRVGITVSSRVGNAVVRNRIKRWIREFARRRMDDLPAGDIVFIAKASAATCTHPVLDRDLARLIARANGPAKR